MYQKVYLLDDQMRDELWFRYFRMKYSTFVKFCDILKPYIEHQDTNYQDVVPVQKAVAMVLHKLAHARTNMNVENMFGVRKTRILKYLMFICNALAYKDKLYPQFIAIPTGRRLKDIIQGFHRVTKLTQICGVIDGSHVKLYRKPPTKYTPADYWCQYNVHTVLLQGICDSNRIFLDVCVLASRDTHDATHMRSSEFFIQLMRRQILQEPNMNIEGETIKPYIIGDSAYPLLQQIQKSFNAKLSGQEYQDAFDKCIRQ